MCRAFSFITDIESEDLTSQKPTEPGKKYYMVNRYKHAMTTPGWLSRWLKLDDVEYRSLRHPKSVCNVFKGSFWMTEVIAMSLREASG